MSITQYLLTQFRSKKPEQNIQLIPTEQELRAWACSEWIEYQAWIFHHSFLTLHNWKTQHADANHWFKTDIATPLISILTPVYNTDPQQLRACIYSVQIQSYPHWQLCLVNDGSDNLDTLAVLEEYTHDTRIHILHLSENKGICVATQYALEHATGEYIAFLDHDDRLAPDAFYWVTKHLQAQPETQIIYSDRDMLSLEGHRFMHLFKPSWSPETLLSGNYLFHLLVYQRRFVIDLGGIRAAFEGSQDYDLILRATDTNPLITHLPKVLYHWRQNTQSVALNHSAKTYAYEAGIRALEETLQRRGLTATVSENPDLWRGNYKIDFASTGEKQYAIINWTDEKTALQQLNRQIQTLDNDCLYIIILGPQIKALSENSQQALLGWLQIQQVAMVTGKILDIHHRLLHAGLVTRANKIPLSLYSGSEHNEAGYMAVTSIARNVSVPHPYCFAIRRTVWEEFIPQINQIDIFGLWQLLTTLAQTSWRCVYNPFACFQYTHKSQNLMIETWSNTTGFPNTWQDPYYSHWLSQNIVDMGLDIEKWRKKDEL